MAAHLKLLQSFLCISLSIVAVFGDTPANCTYPEIVGTWEFEIGKGGYDNTIKCSSVGTVVRKLKVTLKYPDDATDSEGNTGFWTLIYNQGFEVVIDGQSFFAYSKYEGKGPNATSYCDQTLPGWSHKTDGTDWACYQGHKAQRQPPKYLQAPKHRYYPEQRYVNNQRFIDEINDEQSSWKAAAYDELQKFTLRDIVRRNGGQMSKIHGSPMAAPITSEHLDLVRDLPDAFDWRNVNGTDYVSPVRNQGGCGSCYAFGSMGMVEARLRIKTQLQQKTIFSPQDIVECSEYSQGCEGGFPYLISGKYGADFGLVAEQYNPYKGMDHKCSTKKGAPRMKDTRYHYVGGYYGACNEAKMISELVYNGPMAVSFEVYNDFLHYKGGIYHHTGLQDKFNPFEITNHAVNLVGYGADKMTGEKYWIVKNSWGEAWGEKGFFRIRRGTDECSIESIAVAVKV